MKLAIVLGVHDYKNLTKLPGCKKDAEGIFEVLSRSKKFDEILLIDNETTGHSVKLKISEFIAKYKGRNIAEILFYYTGHGSFDGKQYSYLLSDYDAAQKKQTSISNEDIDDWLRALKSNLSIKIIDSCQSGVTYIKADEDMDGYLIKGKNVFENLYFLFSSMKNEESYQSDSYSYFTKSILDCISAKKDSPIRYKDLIDYISDDFESNSLPQKPFFVTQATSTEIFIEPNEEINDFLKQLPSTKSQQGSVPTIVAAGNSMGLLVKKIKEDAVDYCSEDELISRLNLIKENISRHQPKEYLKELFEFKVNVHNFTDVFHGNNQIGRWLQGKGDYFAKPRTTLEEYEVNPLGFFASDTKLLAKRKREVITGYDLTQGVPFVGIEIDANPKHQNIKPLGLQICFLFSKVELVLFYSKLVYKLSNWKQKTFVGDVIWEIQKSKLKSENDVKKAIDNILVSFEDFITEVLKKEFMSSSVKEEGETEEKKKQ